MSYETIKYETRGAVALITLNRPQALNALNSALMKELSDALDVAEKDAGVRCMVITGSEKAFAAGADIKEMQPKTYMEAFTEDFITTHHERVAGH
jgi:enoyl-CoA hydratase/carnithine racemase